MKLGIDQQEALKALRLDYEVEGNLNNKLILVALVERNISTEVKRGENGGRKLQHDNVVRVFRAIELSSSKGSVMLDIPENLDLSKSQVVAYVQDSRSLEISGAAKIGL